MYGKHRAILRSDAKQTVVVAGKSSPDARGGSYHPLGFWEQRQDGQFVAHVRGPEQWYRRVKRDELAMHLCASTRTGLRELVLTYYAEVQSW